MFIKYSSDDLKSYSKACIDLGIQLKTLETEGYLTVVIPSRGAYPFYHQASSSNILDIRMKKEKWDWRIIYKPLLLPFTSDIGIDHDLPNESIVLRKFWCKVLRDYIKKEKTIYSTYYERLVHYIGGEVLGVPIDNLIPRAQYNSNGKFVFIDTVISGRASYEILSTLDDIGISDYHACLFIDKNGEDLKEEYKLFLERKENEGKVTLYRLPNIFSEDCSPLLNDGICSLVFPDIISDSFEKIPDFKRDNNSAGGIWSLDMLTPYYGTEVNGLRACTSMLVHYNVELLKGKMEQGLYDSQFDFLTEMLNKAHEENKVLNREHTNLMAYKRFGKIKDINITTTKSHILRMNFPKEIMDNFRRKIISI